MNAMPTASASAAPMSPVAPANSTPMSMIGILRGLLISEAVIGIGLAVFFSLLAAGMRDFVGGESGRAAETTIRFVAGAAFFFGLFAAIASRGARRRRAWSWTMAAVVQLVLAIGTGLAVLNVAWHPAYLLGFVLAGVTMLVLSAASVRRALGQA